MMNCLDGYLTKKCENCPFWVNTETDLGCNIPAPIMSCPAYKEEYEKENKL